MPTFNQVTVNPSAVARTLTALASLLIILSIAGQLTKYLTGHAQVHRLVRFFYLDAEQNLPTFFSALLLLVSAFLLAIITLFKKEDKSPYVSGWAILSCGFLLMAADELLSLHENLIRPMRQVLGGGTLGVFYFAWVIPGIVVVVIVGLFFLKFLWHLSAKARFTFLVAATLYIGGAIGFELLGGYYAERRQSLIYSIISTVEESLEMIGIIVFIYGLLKYIADNYHEVRFRFDDHEGS